MRQLNTVALQPNLDPEPPSPRDTAEYVRTGPGSWQHIGAVLRRVIDGLHVVDEG